MDVGSWQRYFDEQQAAAKILVVDDEPAICAALEMALEDTGFDIITVSSGEEGWEEIRSRRFELLVTDKNLPFMTGLDLIARIRDSGIDLPAVMITGYPSLDTVASALSTGALDYVVKPFVDIDAVVHKLDSIVRRRLRLRLCDRIVKDLSRELSEEGADADTFAIARALSRFKDNLQRRPDVLLLESPSSSWLAEKLRTLGLTAVCVDGNHRALEALDGEAPALAAILALETPESLTLIEALKAHDPWLVVVATTEHPEIGEALAALSAGASELYLRSLESVETLAARLGYLLATNRRERLFFHLIATLHKAAGGHQHSDLRNLLSSLLSESQLAELDDVLVELDSFASTDDASPELSIPNPEPEAERRRAPRYRVDIPARLIADDTVLHGIVRDVSETGLFFATHAPVAIGSEAAIEVYLSAQNPATATRLRGIVMRTVVHSPDLDLRSGCGILLEPDSRPQVATILEKVPKGLTSERHQGSR